MLLGNNPLIYREWRVATRPARLCAFLLGVAFLLTMAYTFISMREYNRYEVVLIVNLVTVNRQFATFVIGLQFFIAFYWCFGLALDSLVMEKVRSAHEFFITLPISASDKVLGIFLGTTLLPMLAVLLLVPVGLGFGLAGGLDLESMVWLYVLMIAGWAAFALGGLAMSTFVGKARRAWLAVAVLVIVGMGTISAANSPSALAPLLTLSPYGQMVASLADREAWYPALDQGVCSFYGLEAPWQVCPLVLYAFLAVVFYAVSAWRLTRPEGRPLPRLAVLAGFAAFQFLLIGFLSYAFQGYSGYGSEPTWACLTVSFWVVLLWGIGSMPSYARLMEWAESKPRWPVRLITESLSDTRTPSLVAAGVLWVMAAAAVVFIDQLYWHNLHVLNLAAVALVWLVFMMAYLSICLAGCVSARYRGKATGVVLIGVVAAVPLIFSAGIENLEWLRNATPVGMVRYCRDLVNGRIMVRYCGDLVSGRIVENMHWGDPATLSLAWGLCLLLIAGLWAARGFRVMLRISPRAGKLAARSA